MSDRSNTAGVHERRESMCMYCLSLHVTMNFTYCKSTVYNTYRVRLARRICGVTC